MDPPELTPDIADLRGTEAWSMRLYERARREQWALGEAIDAGMLRLDSWPRAVHGALRHVYSEVRWGEILALAMSARLVDAAPDAAVERFGTTQVADEARHVDFFTRLLASLGDLEEPGEALSAFGKELRSLSDVDEILLGSQVILEGYAQCLFTEGASAGERAAARRIHLPNSPDPRPLLTAISRYIGRDESRHVAFGVLYLRDRVRRAGASDRRRLNDSARRWQAAMDALLGETEPSLRRIGIDTSQVRQRVRRTQAAHLRHIGLEA